MAIINALQNGNAPSNAKVGDFISTGGGYYRVVSPGTQGASYNPDSGFWSQKVDHSLVDQALDAYAGLNANKNSALSQSYAERQMQFQTEANAKAMQFSADEAQKNRDFQERMSSSSYQRAVADLMAAGLNPVLAAMNGGSSTPSGSAASGVTSAGASGTVDNSQLAFIGSIISAMINQKTAMYTSDNALQASIYSADMNAKTQMGLQEQQQDFETYLRENYPDNEFQFYNSVKDEVIGRIKDEIYERAPRVYELLFGDSKGASGGGGRASAFGSGRR